MHSNKMAKEQDACTASAGVADGRMSAQQPANCGTGQTWDDDGETGQCRPWETINLEKASSDPFCVFMALSLDARTCAWAARSATGAPDRRAVAWVALG